MPRISAWISEENGDRPRYFPGLLTPYGGVEMAAERRTLRLGWRFELGRLLSLSLAGERHEAPHTTPEHALMLQTTLPW